MLIGNYIYALRVREIARESC